MTSPFARAVTMLGLLAFLLAAPFFSAGAQEGHNPIPATPTGTGAWTEINRQELVIDGQMVTLSPDGQWIAGTGPEREFCIWAVESLEPTCDVQEFAIQADSIRWAPDSTAVAWSVDVYRAFHDSDIQLMEVATGEVTNLTDDGFSDSLPLGSDDVLDPIPVDIMPAWRPDSQSLVFVRTVWSTGDETDGPTPTDLMEISRAGGEPTRLATVRDDFPKAIFLPVFVLDDGSLLYSVAVNDVSDPGNGLWLLDPTGETTQLLPGAETEDYPVPAITDVLETGDGLLVSGYSYINASQGGVQSDPAFVLDTATGAVTPVSGEDFGVDGTAPVRFSPDGTATIGAEWIEREPHLVIRDETGSTDLGAIGPSRSTFSRGYEWADNDTILVTHLDGTGILLTVSSVAGN